jgi:hypothetical protein
MASICDTINCTDGLPTVPTPDCGGINYGRKVVRLYVGEIDANPFASTSNIQTLADWNTRLAQPSTGNTQVRLVSLGYIYEGLKGEGEVETEENENWENETYTCVCESCLQEAEFYGESAETTCFERNGLI